MHAKSSKSLLFTTRGRRFNIVAEFLRRAVTFRGTISFKGPTRILLIFLIPFVVLWLGI